ncbi:hypothetical protein [Microbulbifer hydrolyticus]|uniref:Vacuolar-type H+-ATPase subunit I/STV1 n=1 Tax=Microbulbifer hydrolyticus TaxID=48074 RepID=A0A6P1TH76_9GAMM|nr:hypothetical protein [Microbulbifer hydrolyticus]MBB5212553.1 vacuolar-type H+-ATPase subunit I/STV1 [Microbulbifer hydrolyticus]QHQ40172.1 hypothetical protein GTQ55_15080 [Microbulbifer hydrolyticus]
MIIKVILLVAVMTYFARSSNWLNAAIFWGVGVLLLSFIFGGVQLGAIIGAAISFAIALGVFKLLDHLEGAGAWYWVAYVFGIAALIVVA